MSASDLAAPLPRNVRVSFEFFPPNSDRMETLLWASIKRLAPIEPTFVSVTYGAGGSTRERTHATVSRIRRETSLEPAAHLTCVGATRKEVDDIAQTYWDDGIRHIVALRGDPPEGDAGYCPHSGGYAYASDLVSGLKKIADFEISVGAYPETHPEAASPKADLDNLKRKIDAGASRAITQFFFDNDAYLRFLDRARDAGITIPIVPGILPVTNFARAVEFGRKCGTAIPAGMAELFDGLDEDAETSRLVAAMFAARQCRSLYDHGVDQFHFYTVNRADLTYAVCHILGVRPEKDPEKDTDQE